MKNDNAEKLRLALNSCLSGHGVHNIIIYSGLSHNFHLPFSFQDIILVICNLYIQVLILKFFHRIY